MGGREEEILDKFACREIRLSTVVVIKIYLLLLSSTWWCVSAVGGEGRRVGRQMRKSKEKDAVKDYNPNLRCQGQWPLSADQRLVK